MYVQHVGEPSFLYPAPLYTSLAPVYSTGMGSCSSISTSRITAQVEEGYKLAAVYRLHVFGGQMLALESRGSATMPMSRIQPMSIDTAFWLCSTR